MRYAVLLSFLATLAMGCNSDPKTSRLQSGQTVIVVPVGSWKTVKIRPISGDDFPEGSPGWRHNAMRTGDRCMVIADESPDKSGLRSVIVEVTRYDQPIPSIDLTGVRCRVERENLRPTP